MWQNNADGSSTQAFWVWTCDQKKAPPDAALLDQTKMPTPLASLEEIAHAAAASSGAAPVTKPDEAPDWGEADGEENDDRPPIPRRRGGRFLATRQTFSDFWGRSSEQDRSHIIGQMQKMDLDGESICHYALGSNDVPDGTELVFDLDTLYALGKRMAGENGLSSAKK